MKVWEFEKKVWELDGVRIVVRASGNAQVLDYPHANAVSKTMGVTGYLKNRIGPKIAPYDAVVVGGAGDLVHGRTKISRVRESYGK